MLCVSNKVLLEVRVYFGFDGRVGSLRAAAASADCYNVPHSCLFCRNEFSNSFVIHFVPLHWDFLHWDFSTWRRRILGSDGRLGAFDFYFHVAIIAIHSHVYRFCMAPWAFGVSGQQVHHSQCLIPRTLWHTTISFETSKLLTSKVSTILLLFVCQTVAILTDLH